MTGNCCRDKAVVVVVYTEKPREKQGGRRRYHRNVDGRVRGYNTRAELLDYARHLRAPAPQSHPSSPIKQSQVLAADGVKKKSHSSPPTCFDKWSFVVTRFLRCTTAPKTKQKRNNHKKNVSTTTKMKALVKSSLEVKKRGGFLTKLLTALQKQR